MIHAFSVANYLSVREEIVLDLRIPGTAPDLTCFRKSQARPGVRLPAVVVLMGPNGSGKTTVLSALAKMFQIASADLGDQKPIGSVLPFMSSECVGRPSRFCVDLEADWLAPGETPTAFRYVLEVERVGCEADGHRLEDLAINDVSVRREALFHFPKGRPRRLMERCESAERIYAGPEFGLRGRDDRLRAVRPDASVISTLDALNVPLAGLIAERFRGYLHSTNLDVRGNLGTDQLVTMLDMYPGLMDRMRNDIQCSDLGIRDVEIKEGVAGKTFWFDHAGVDAPIPIGFESRGTNRLLHLLPQINLALDQAGVAVFDEIDADLHVDIVEELMHWFRSRERNPLGAQLLLTSHNVGLLDNMEKEELYIVEKSRCGATRIHGAQEVEGLRRDARLYSKYRAGVIGGVPNIG